MICALAFFANTSNGGPIGFFIVLVGVLLFVLGFRTYRRYRILEDTPLMPIRSLSMGLVHISGTCIGDKVLTAPISKVPCYYYKVELEREVEKDDGGTEWKSAGTVLDVVPFYVQDSTGKVLLNPANAEYDITRSYRGEFKMDRALLSFGNRHPGVVDASLGVAPPTEEQLRAYLTGEFASAYSGRLNQMRAQTQSSSAPAGRVMSAVLEQMEKVSALQYQHGNYRLTEHCLVAGRTCNIMGTCAENPEPADERDRNLIKKGENEKTYLISTNTEKQIEKGMKRLAVTQLLFGSALIVGGVACILAAAHLF